MTNMYSDIHNIRLYVIKHLTLNQNVKQPIENKLTIHSILIQQKETYSYL